MMKNVLGVFLVMLSWMTVAEASHPLPPFNLKQEANCGQPTCPAVAVGVFLGSTEVRLTASSDPGTCDSLGTYKLEFEIQPSASPFTNVPTHSSGSMSKPNCAPQEYPYTAITGLPPGSYKWQAREVSASGAGSWVAFASGATAFMVGNPADADVFLTSVSLANVVGTASDLQFDLAFVVKNFGQLPATDFQWKAYLSTNKVLDASDTIIFESTAPLTVAALTAETFTQAIAVAPKPASNDYFVLVELDVTGVVTEYDENNNVGSTTTPFTAGVELLANDVSGPTAMGPGNTVAVNVMYFNQGTDAVASLDYKIYLSKDNTLNSSDFLFYQGTKAILAGQTISEAISVTVPGNAPGGEYYYILQVDSANAFAERNENNNVAVSTQKVRVDNADLKVESARFVDVASALPINVGFLGQNGRVQVQLTNSGTANALAFKVGVIISADNSLSLLGDTLVYEHMVSQLNVGQTANLDFQFPIPLKDKAQRPFPTGTYYLFVLADSKNAVGELNENNNWEKMESNGSPEITLKTPGQDYAVLWVDAASKGASGERVPVTRTIKNIGSEAGQPMNYRYYASANNIITTNDVPLRMVDGSGALVDQGSLTLNVGVADSKTEWVEFPPTLPPGDYFLGVLADFDQRLAELDEANNAGSAAFVTSLPTSVVRMVTALPDGTVNQPYVGQVAVEGISGTVAWSIDSTTGSLPTGLTLASDGRLTGTPIEPGFYAFTLQAVWSDKRLVERRAIRVLPPGVHLEITSRGLPALLNRGSTSYAVELGAVGGQPPYTWRVVSGELPNGLVLHEAGILSGVLRMASETKQYPFVVQVRDSLGLVDQANLTLRLVAPAGVYIETTALSSAQRGSPYEQPLQVKNADGTLVQGPVTWTVAQGSLPPGLTLDPSGETGALIQGTPLYAGHFGLALAVEDGQGRSDVLEFWLYVKGGVLFPQAPSLPSVVRWAETVNVAFEGENAVGATTFRVFQGLLPKGLALNAAGVLEGTVADDATARTYNFVVEARDQSGNIGWAPFAIEVLPEKFRTGCGCTSSGEMGVCLTGLALWALRRRKVVRR